MKKALALVLVLLFAGYSVHAAEEVSEKRSEADEQKMAESRKKIQEHRTELNGSSWEVTLGSGAKGEADTFTFQNGQFSSKSLAKRGFSPTNYTVSIPSDSSGLAVWETMQTGKEGLIFLRGEWDKDMMRGDVTEQLEEGKKIKDYSFSTSGRTAIPPSSASEEKTEASSADAGAPAVAVDAPEALVSKTNRPPKK